MALLMPGEAVAKSNCAIPKTLDAKLRKLARRYGAQQVDNWLSESRSFLVQAGRIISDRTTENFIISARRYARPSWLDAAIAAEHLAAQRKRVADLQADLVWRQARFAVERDALARAERVLA